MESVVEQPELLEPKPFSAPWKNSDIILVADGVEFHVHRSILCVQSSVFETMLNGSFKEASQERITLEGKDPEEMREFLKLLYPLNVFGNPLKNENLLSMLALADEYQANAVMKQCLNEATITPSNVLNILLYATTYDQSIRQKCVNFAQKMVTYENLKKNIDSPEIDVQQEVQAEIWAGKYKMLEDTLAIAQEHIVACMRILSEPKEKRNSWEKAICCFSHGVEVVELSKARDCKPCLVAFKKRFCDSTIRATKDVELQPSRIAFGSLRFGGINPVVPHSDTQQPATSKSQELLNLLEDMDDLLHQRSK